MRGYPGQYLGLDAAQLIGEVDACRGRIERMRDGLEPQAPIDFPSVPLVPSP